MPRISILRLTDRDAVMQAIAEYDARGAEDFLTKHRFGRADDYFLLHEGRTYDSKAIAGVAYGIQHGVEVTPRDFSGGERTVAKALERLGFVVTRPGQRDTEVRSSEVQSVTRDADLRTSTRQDPTERRRQVEAAWGVMETPAGYRPQTQRKATERPPPPNTPAALLSPYLGPRRVAPRTAAEPRLEEPELFDRANEAHEVVRSKLVRFLVEHGFSVYDASTVARQQSVDFDLVADGGELRLVIEAKSMPSEGKAEAARLRMGLGQVLWYRHRFFASCGERRVALLVVEREPRDHEDWDAVCREAGVVLTWPERFEVLVDACRCAQALATSAYL